MKTVLACLLLKLIFVLSWIEIRQKIRHSQWENSFTHIRYIYNQKFKKKINKIADEKKMSGEVEESK